MNIDDIQPGMKGVGKTVFSGTTVEEFDVEILGVLKNESPHGDVIMAKISGGPLPIEKFGIIAGMSGSPVYIDGKLIGAVAFGSIFPKEPMIAGITPIHEMLADAERVASDGKTSRNTAVPISGFTVSSTYPSNFVPIQTPLVVSGVDPRVLTFMQARLASFGMFPVQGGAVSQELAQKANPEFQPGSAIGVQLIRGDMNASAVGTLTYRDNDKIIAFGHPMFSAGNVNFPMTSAYVHFIMSNQIIPYKVTSPLDTVGTITQDRRAGISGVLGLPPRMVPLKVSVQYDGEPTTVKPYFFEVIDHPLFVPLLMSMAGSEALLATENVLGDATIQTQTTIALKEHAPLTVTEMFTGKQNILMGVAQAFAPLNALLLNSFAPVSLEQVSVAITVKHTIQLAEIVGVHIQDNVVRPGELVEATISLAPYGEELITITEGFRIPEDLQQEKIQLLICDANLNNAIEAARAAPKFQPQNLDQLIRLLGEHVSQNHMIMSLLQIKPGVILQGQEFPSPPVSMLSLVGAPKRSAGEDNLTRGRILMRKDIPTQYIVSGGVALELTIDHSNKGTDGSMEENVKPMQGESLPW